MVASSSGRLEGRLEGSEGEAASRGSESRSGFKETTMEDSVQRVLFGGGKGSAPRQRYTGHAAPRDSDSTPGKGFYPSRSGVTTSNMSAEESELAIRR